MVVIIDSGITFQRYSKVFESEWEAFLQTNKCFTFQFQRSFLDLYAEEVVDASYLVRESSGELIALIPLGEFRESKKLISHPKSSYGGFFYRPDVSLQRKEAIYSQFLEEIRKSFNNYALEVRTSIKSFNPVESSQERWLLWRFGFKLNQVVLHSYIDLHMPKKLNTKRIKYENSKIQIIETKSPKYLRSFWDLLQENLSLRHNAVPTHNFTQIMQLIEVFPIEVRVFLAFDNSGQVLGGLVFFNTANGFHLQYMAIGQLGRQLSVGDLLINNALKIATHEAYDIFNFGHSNEQSGIELNYNLFSYKSKFGSRLDEALRWSLQLGESLV